MTNRRTFRTTRPPSAIDERTLSEARKVRAARRASRQTQPTPNTDDALYAKAWGAPAPDTAGTPTGGPLNDEALYANAWGAPTTAPPAPTR